ncbi:MAG TPA: sulfatase-like hydrolase/transferase [Ornithinicoccus sp.]|nr:sulfatase-like hydrolase/transferase [Ornithinicoccus sp.]
MDQLQTGGRRRLTGSEPPVSDSTGAPSDRLEGRRRVAGLSLLLFLVASMIYLEIVLRIQTDSQLVGDGLLYTTLFAGATSFVIFLIASFLRGAGRTIVVGLLLGAMTVIFMSQFLYYDTFRTFYSVFSAMNGGQLTEFMGVILVKIRENSLWLLLLAVPMILFFVLLRRGTWARHRFKWLERGVAAVLMIGLFGAAILGINVGEKEHASAYDMYYRNNDPVASVNALGLMTSMRLDLQRTVLGFEPELAPPPVVVAPEPDPDDPVEAPSEGPSLEPPDTPAGESDVPDPEPVVYEDNVMDIDFDKLMAEAESEELRNMHLYFSTREATQENEHTGMFEGYNLVFITAEGYSHYAVDEEVTPTLHKMTHEGFTFTSFYNPIWGVSTSDGEYVATTGLIPKSGVWSMFKSGSNAMPFAMGNQLGRLGYKTMAYHNHTFDYYRRDVSHPNLGYDYKGLGNGLEVTKTWPESDIEMIDVTTEEFVHDEPFHAYYMTVSGHLLYNFGGNFIAVKNRDLVQDLPYGEAGKAYMATQIELDRALELLMERLEGAGVADRTLIVLSADHYPYGLEKPDLDDLAGHEVEENFELHKSSLIIYAKGMQPETVDQPVSSLDIIPTISNLMGLEFDSRLLMGRDVFSDADPLVIFNNRSFITDKGRYNSVTREFTANEGIDVPDDYQQVISDEIDRRFYYSTMILDRDYYSTVVDR